MRTEQLRYLLEVASCGSISAAAKQLYINQTTLSAAIQSIEAELGGKLFQRTPKGVTLTQFGEAALPKIREIVMRCDELLQLEGGNATVPKQIHMCIYSCVCHFWSLYLTAALRQKNVNTLVTIHESSGNQVFANIREGKATIGIGACFERKLNTLQGQVENCGLILEPLYLEAPYIYVSASSPLASRKILSRDDLTQEHLAINNCCLERFYSGKFSSLISQISVFTSMETAKDAVRHNNMVCIFPNIAVEAQSMDGLVAIPMAEADEEKFLCYIIHPCPGDMNLAERIVVDAVRQWCKENRSLGSRPQ